MGEKHSNGIVSGMEMKKKAYVTNISSLETNSQMSKADSKGPYSEWGRACNWRAVYLGASLDTTLSGFFRSVVVVHMSHSFKKEYTHISFQIYVYIFNNFFPS